MSKYLLRHSFFCCLTILRYSDTTKTSGQSFYRVVNIRVIIFKSPSLFAILQLYSCLGIPFGACFADKVTSCVLVAGVV